ncbi:polysaccharide pyruvyl transferase family protein [Dactylosporangium darangshiense]|uniref:Polysaccharide pyruvyl transferase family protein n=1 Tax=Dactylosporangium darangshiense TaxID=579108 RepID=A0ABP8DAK1_9ACTN
MSEHGPRVGVLGSYGGYNLGDEAILASILSDLRARRPDAEVLVLSRDLEHTAKEHPGVTVAPWEGVSRDRTADVLSRLDLLVVGGGGILYDTEARRYLRVVRTAQEQRVPVFTYAIGAGPLTEDLDCAMARDVLGAATEVTVRDDESKVALEEAGVTAQVTVTADPALLLQPEEFDAGVLHDSLPPGRRVVGMSVREPGRAAQHLAADEYHQLLAHVADFVVHRLDASVLFVPMERSDIRHSHAVLSRMTAAEQCRVLHGQYRPGQILDLMRHLDLAVGMRLHFLIFAALSGVPLLALPYAGKVFDFAQRIGAPVPLGVVREAAGPLIAQVDRLWDERPQRQEEVAARVAGMRQRATETGRRLSAQLDRIAPLPERQPVVSA